jgi:CoA:oxalate CoA-transferase
MKILEDILVIDFSQFLSGPCASLRLADLGAEVIKIEQPVTGDICRSLYVSDTMIEGDSTIFHAINRNKKSFIADLKNKSDLENVKEMLRKADVMIHNFRPGVMERLGLSYHEVKELNPGIIYAAISGYGSEGPWANLPGQDLLLQAVSGLTWLSGDESDPPTPMGVSIADIYTGTHLVQGILTTLYERNLSGTGSLVEVSMLESVLDFQFEVLTCYYNDGYQPPQRSLNNSAHAFVSAPYGIYKTMDGFLALAMGSITVLADLINCEPLKKFTTPSDWFSRRDEIKETIQQHLAGNVTRHWLELLEPFDFWCAEVFDFETLRKTDGYRSLKIEQIVSTTKGVQVSTTRCPIRIDGEILTNEIGAPFLGEHNPSLSEKFGLKTR